MTKKTKNSGKATKKTVSKTNTKNTKSRRKNLNECVGFVYGGDCMKASVVRVFAVNEKDPTTYLKENLVPHYGSKIGGRYVKCENSEETLKTLLNKATEDNSQCEKDCNLLKLSIQNGANLLREVSGSNVAHTIKLNTEKLEKESKNVAKADKADKVDNDLDADSEDEHSDASEDDKDNVESDDDVTDEENSDASDAEEGNDSESEEEEEPVKPKSKTAKNTRNQKSTKKSSNSKQSGKTKNVKKRK